MKEPEPVAPEAASQPEGRITGPSFLGLSEQPDENRSLDYLYEDEPRHHYGRLILAILVLAAFGAFIAYQWEQRPNWYAGLSNPFSRPAAQPPVERASSEVPPPPAATGDTPKTETDASTQTPPPAAVPSADSAAQSSTDPPPAQPAAPVSMPQADTEQTSAVERSRDSSSTSAAPVPDEGSSLLTRGLAYLNGTGVPRNCNQALVFLTSAARRGNAKANSQLGGLYATGHCVPLDRARAYQYFTRARDAEHGRNVYIEHNREMLWSQMSDAEKAQARTAQ